MSLRRQQIFCRWLLFGHRLGAIHLVYAVEANGKEDYRSASYLADGKSVYDNLIFSGDVSTRPNFSLSAGGARMAFMRVVPDSVSGFNYYLFEANIDGSGMNQVYDAGRQELIYSSVAISPDGRKIFYSTMTGENSLGYVFDVASGHLSEKLPVMDVTWSPDSSELYGYNSLHDSQGFYVRDSAYLLKADGTIIKKLDVHSDGATWYPH